MREIIAILRGITPEEVLATAEVIVSAGITQIEVPLNSPNALESIRILANYEFAEATIIGAGTVLSHTAVQEVFDVGGELIVTPNYNASVITKAKELGMMMYPGVQTSTESFAALDAGADGLKFFPGFLLGTAGLKALRAVLPAGTKTYAVGGADHTNFGEWVESGITGFGIGSALYKAGDSVTDVEIKAKLMVEAYDEAFANK